MQRGKNWLQKGAFSCWLVLTNWTHTTRRRHTRIVTHWWHRVCARPVLWKLSWHAQWLAFVGKCCRVLPRSHLVWSRSDLALISLFQPPFPRNKPVPFKGAVNRGNWLKTMSGLRSGQYKVMLIWREHPAAMSAVPLSTATSAVIKRNSVTQALLQRLPSAFPLWSAAQICSLWKRICAFDRSVYIGEWCLTRSCWYEGNIVLQWVPCHWVLLLQRW